MFEMSVSGFNRVTRAPMFDVNVCEIVAMAREAQSSSLTMN